MLWQGGCLFNGTIGAHLFTVYRGAHLFNVDGWGHLFISSILFPKFTSFWPSVNSDDLGDQNLFGNFWTDSL